MADIRTRASRYSNPRLGAAFENLADVFAPPSGTDLYGYTKAASEKQKQTTLADIVARSRDPNTDRRVLDQLNTAVGNGTPTQGWIALETKDATDRHKIGVDDARGRADFASRDATSVANNVRDNERALVNQIMTAIPEGGTVVRPPAVAQKHGVPETSTGVVKLNPGQSAAVPGGPTLQGNAKPLSVDEVKAQTMLNDMSPEERRAIGFADTPVVETGKGPMTRPQQLATGTPKIDTTQPQAFNSNRGPVIWDPVKRAYVPAPAAGANISGGLQSPSGVQSKDPLGSTTANLTAATEQEARLDVLDKKLAAARALVTNNPGIVGIPGQVRGFVQNAASVVQEFSAAFGKTPLDAVITPDQMEQVKAKVGVGDRDPAIAQFRVMLLDLAYARVQAAAPTGEVSRQALERQLEAISGGSLANNKSFLETLTAMEEAAKTDRIGVQSRRNPGGTSAGPRVLKTPAGNVTIEPVQ